MAEHYQSLGQHLSAASAYLSADMVEVTPYISRQYLVLVLHRLQCVTSRYVTLEMWYSQVDGICIK